MAAMDASGKVGDNIDKIKDLNTCTAVMKMKEGRLHEITYEHTKRLIDILDTSQSGDLDVEELRVLKEIKELNLSDEDIDNLIQDCDKDGSKGLNPEELHEALQQGSLNMKIMLEQLGHGAKRRENTECTRDELLEFLEYEQETNDALCSLPITLFSFFLYIMLVSVHLQVHTAYGMQSAIQGEVEGEGKPYLGTYVHDVPTFWTWMQQSYVGAQFKSSADKLKQYPYPGRFAVYNQIIGGTQVVKYYSTENTTCAGSGILPQIYDQLGDRCHKAGPEDSTSEFFPYHLQSGVLIEHIQYLDEIDWVTHDTRQLDFTNVYYNANLEQFTDFHLTIDWQGDGFVKILFGLESWAADPYNEWWYIVIDAVYILILCRMTYQELSEMLPRLLNGLDGFIQYWEFWNVVDWLNIVLGSVSFVVWGLVCTKTSGDLQEAIAQLPTKRLDEWVTTNQTYFTMPELQEVVDVPTYYDQIANVHSISGEIAAMHTDLRSITFFYSFTLMLKFFKSFQANPRLNIVVMTMSESAVDIIHFSIVFATIFFVFSLMAHVIFGSKMIGFHTQFRSLCMTWRILLGDFPLDDMEAIDINLANLWFFAFQVLVMMILLNMLLAIIMDTYSAVSGQSGEKLTIWAQTFLAINTVRETRGHLPLLYIRCEMEDEDEKAHPGEQVTSKSLRKAFERDKMTRNNAEYLIRKTNEYLRSKAEECELKMSDAIKLVGQTKTIVCRISDTAESTLGMLKAQQNAPKEARQNAIMAGIDPDRDPHWQEKMREMEGGIVPSITNGVPVGNTQQTGGFPQTGGYPQDFGHPHAIMDTNAPMMGGTTMGVQGAQPRNGNYGAPMPNDLYNNGTQQTYGQFSNSNASTTLSGASNPNNMTNNSMVSMAQSQQGMAAPQMQAMMAPQMQGGMSGHQMQQLVQQISMLERTQTANFSELKSFIDQRDAWMGDRMNQLDRRCQKVEVLSDRLYTLLRDIDVQKLADVPKDVRQALSDRKDKNAYREMDEWGTRGVYADEDNNNLVFPNGGGSDSGRSGHSSNHSALRETAMSDIPRSPPIGLDHSRQSGVGHAGGAHLQQLEQRMDGMTEKIEHLLSLAEETPKITSMLWRMDLNLRQLTGTANNLPPGHPLLQQQQRQQQQAHLAIESHPHVRQSSRQVTIANRQSISGQNSQQGSRMVSKSSFSPVRENGQS